MTTILFSIIFSAVTTFSSVPVAQAQNQAAATSTSTIPATSTATVVATSTFSWDGNLKITNNTGQSDIGGIASKLITWLLAIIALVSTVMIIYAGFLMVINAGNEGRIAQAKSTLIWAIIGLVVAIGAFAIVTMVQGVLS